MNEERGYQNNDLIMTEDIKNFISLGINHLFTTIQKTQKVTNENIKISYIELDPLCRACRDPCHL